MSSALDIVTKFINSPGGVLTAGAVLAGIVWKFFERVEAVLTDNTKLEIAVWLVGVKTADKVPWPQTFASMFDRVFGIKHLSWKCFGRSAVATLVSCSICAGFATAKFHMVGLDVRHIPVFALVATSYLCIFDYVSLLETRWLMAIMRRWTSFFGVLLLLCVDIMATGMTGLLPSVLLEAHKLRVPVVDQAIGEEYRKSMHELAGSLKEAASATKRMRESGEDELSILKKLNSLLDLPESAKEVERNRALLPTVVRTVFWLPAFFTSIWLWLYAGSGFLLKAARRFDIGFDWFNGTFDIEKKPLQSIGLVAGAIVAVVYWTVAGISRVL